MYGRYPAAPARVEGRTLFEDATAFGGNGTLREIELTFGPPEWPKIYLLVASPNSPIARAVLPRPQLRRQSHAVGRRAFADSRMPKAHGVIDGNRRGTQAETHDLWPLEEAVGRGYAIATFYCGDIQPDRPNVREGDAGDAA